MQVIPCSKNITSARKSVKDLQVLGGIDGRCLCGCVVFVGVWVWGEGVCVCWGWVCVCAVKVTEKLQKINFVKTNIYLKNQKYLCM